MLTTQTVNQSESAVVDSQPLLELDFSSQDLSVLSELKAPQPSSVPGKPSSTEPVIMQAPAELRPEPEQISPADLSDQMQISVHHPQPDQPIHPGDPYWVSNYQSNVSVAAHNGMANDELKRRRYLDVISELGGRNVIQVVNETSGVVADFCSSVLGSISSHLGFESEREAVHDQMRVIERHILQGGSVNVTHGAKGCMVEFSAENEGSAQNHQLEFPHSQGVINTSNALFLLREKYLGQEDGEEKWAAIANRVHIYAFGAGGHIWPEGIEVHSYAHENDPVSEWSYRANMLTALWRGVLWDDAQLVKPVTLSNESNFDDHDAAGYREDFARFFVEEYRNDPESLAERLARTIKGGYHPDSVHNEIIDQIIDGQETITRGLLIFKRSVPSPTSRKTYKATFARRFLELASITGYIDNFEIPRLEELKALAT